MTMKVSEFAKRARARRLSKKERFDAAFERARRDLRLLDAEPSISPPPVPGFRQRHEQQSA
jgi:hypothetical protein